MYHTRNIKVVLILCCALFLFFTLTTICAAQLSQEVTRSIKRPPDVSSYQVLEAVEDPDHPGVFRILVKPDTVPDNAALWERVAVPQWANDDVELRERYIQATLDHRYLADRESSGWFIYNAELIPGPYDVVVRDSTIEINGMHVYPRLYERPPSAGESDQKIVARAELSNDFWASFRRWTEEAGLEKARGRAVEYMLAQPIIDTAYLSQPGVMMVKYYDDRPPVSFSLVEQAEMQLPITAEEFRTTLEAKAVLFRNNLSHKGLLIYWDNRLTILPQFYAEVMLLALERYADTIADQDERFAAIQKMIGNKRIARYLAENFKQH